MARFQAPGHPITARVKTQTSFTQARNFLCEHTYSVHVRVVIMEYARKFSKLKFRMVYNFSFSLTEDLLDY